ncbi:type IV pilus assembly protein PilC [Microvirgula sp. AG722]|uniref:type II secretion system F family protein n=1 Tax=Microvirgula sp. AG722 TaxID=2183901 RepID=UPI000DC37820|nr:type II secretion system F family protein [Microvirgula sp. AG722]RAS17121.1 type IV pilus assembly protein PilC [Microvirgula sp. AG722]
MHYQLLAADRDGRVRRHRLNAANLADLEQRAAALGLTVIHLETRAGLLTRAAPRRVSRRTQIDFFLQLEHLLGTGLPLLDALRELDDDSVDAAMRHVLAVMSQDLERGSTLSAAMRAHPRAFGPVIVALVEAGELSGELPVICARLSDMLRRDDEQRTHSIRLLMYPLFVAGVLLAVCVFLLLYLLPQLVGFLDSLGAALPWQTRLLIGTASAAERYGPWLAALPLLTLASWRLACHRFPPLLQHADRWRLALPLLGPIRHQIALSRFAAGFALLYSAGIPLLTVLERCEQLVGNRAVAAALADARRRVAGGSTLADALATGGLFPPRLRRLIRLGEQTGALGRMLAHADHGYQRDIRAGIDRLQRLIEPSLTVLLGLILAWVLSAVLSPLHSATLELTR